MKLNYKVILTLLILFLIGFYFKSKFSFFLNKPSVTKRLLLENISLKEELKEVKERVGFKEGKFLKAKVYAFSPFNDQKNILINLGRNDGLKEGQSVLLEKKIFLGKITKVFSHQSEVETIFSLNFKEPVIFQNKTQALLVGGIFPKVKYIPLQSGVKNGDEIYVLRQNLPYLYVGKIENLKKESSFEEGTVSIDINYKKINEVFVPQNN